MLCQFVQILLVLSTIVTVLALIFVAYRPEVAFLLALLAIPLWVYVAYSSNMIELVDVATNTTKIYYDRGTQTIAVGGLLFSTITLYLAGSQYGTRGGGLR